MKTKRAKSSYVLIIGIMTLIMVGAWIMYQVYAALTKSQMTTIQQKSIIPLDGSISKNVIDNLDQRRKFAQSDFATILLNDNLSENLSENSSQEATDSSEVNSSLTQ